MKIEYKIVDSFDITRLEESITYLLNEGWELSGGITVSNNGHLYQAMIRRTET